ncbi:hypothetical protein AHAS_Ahas16G0208200 [Arachis hypogaea]
MLFIELDSNLTQQPLSEFDFQSHNLCKQPLSYRCNSLEPMYANITSVSNFDLTGETLSSQCMY